MLVQNAYELVDRCCQHVHGLLDLDQLKQAFIDFVFDTYQQQVVSAYDLDLFYEHLESIGLKHCRKDFDWAVEQWHVLQYGRRDDHRGFHDELFALVKKVVADHHPADRDELLSQVTFVLTDPSALMEEWRKKDRHSVSMYFQYLDRLGIRTYGDVEALVDAWLIEYPRAFEKSQQDFFSRPSRRGRPNNLELLTLLEKVREVKPELTNRERERMRKIYYYYRHSLNEQGMVEKFRRYVSGTCRSG